jgi:hypothetical protein
MTRYDPIDGLFYRFHKAVAVVARRSWKLPERGQSRLRSWPE